MENTNAAYNDLFYSELNTETPDNEDIECLITHQPLIEHFQTLSCGHSFNYLPLYTYICYSKTPGVYVYNLQTNTFRCPYCRCIQYKLLPYIPMDGVSLTGGVNSNIHKSSTPVYNCMYISSIGKQCEVEAKRKCNGDRYCIRHYKIKINEMISTNNSSTILQPIPEPNNVCKYVYVKGIKKNTPCGVELTGYNATICLCKRHDKKKTV